MSQTTQATKATSNNIAVAWQLCMAFMLCAVVIMLPDLALARTKDTPMGDVLCIVVDWFTGNTGKGLATIAITIIGIGALLGKVSWGMAMIVGIGVAIVFGAAGIVDAMDAGSSDAQGNIQNTCEVRGNWNNFTAN